MKFRGRQLRASVHSYDRLDGSCPTTSQFQVFIRKNTPALPLTGFCAPKNIPQVVFSPNTIFVHIVSALFVRPCAPSLMFFD